ncbi:uncharacterized protein MELLADRAFT_114489 [Melampsora larici-populina 98AG31]|uniref:Uncharacterized protein n=1 Tax=Melampsora larici-populina (strain 98AG31 / pathotype 3-4-7) TaxID=747676 RepID=F4SDN6_MELLP|nr:uncharacterized protein MELLADRAFT_114489 [Melampsora larici-populina 98AG31]EGF97240.1 hypothetical protein MELLADRAFT_114489 [Melampsora larici-populina 98AG31]
MILSTHLCALDRESHSNQSFRYFKDYTWIKSSHARSRISNSHYFIKPLSNNKALGIRFRLISNHNLHNLSKLRQLQPINRDRSIPLKVNNTKYHLNSMAPITPSSNKGSNKKARSSANKKANELNTPLLERRLSKGVLNPKSILSKGSSALESNNQPSMFNNDEDEEMDTSPDDPNTQSVPTNFTDPPLDLNQEELTLPDKINSKKRTLSESTKSKSTTVNSEDEDEEQKTDDDEVDEENSKKVELEPEIIDKATGTAIIGGHVMIPATSDMPLSAYPRAGELDLFTINPLLQLRKPGLAPTANLPFELQLWWNLYSDTYVSESDISLWAMVKVLNEGRTINHAEIIKSSLSHVLTYLELITGPGKSQFYLFRFKTALTKDNFRKNTRLDRGIFISINGPIKNSFIIFNLDPVSKLTPIMNSLLVSVSGLPFHLRHKNICEEVFNGLAAHKSNDCLEIASIREPNTSPTFTHYNKRVFEIQFERKAAAHWFNALSQEKGNLLITPWNKKGDEFKNRTKVTNWKFIPACHICGTSSYDGSHRTKCPYVTIRDDLQRIIESSYTNRSPTDLTNESDNFAAGASSSQPKMAKVGKFTRHE